MRALPPIPNLTVRQAGVVRRAAARGHLGARIVERLAAGAPRGALVERLRVSREYVVRWHRWVLDGSAFRRIEHPPKRGRRRWVPAARDYRALTALAQRDERTVGDLARDLKMSRFRLEKLLAHNGLAGVTRRPRRHVLRQPGRRDLEEVRLADIVGVLLHPAIRAVAVMAPKEPKEGRPSWSPSRGIATSEDATETERGRACAAIRRLANRWPPPVGGIGRWWQPFQQWARRVRAVVPGGLTAYLLIDTAGDPEGREQYTIPAGREWHGPAGSRLSGWCRRQRIRYVSAKIREAADWVRWHDSYSHLDPASWGCCGDLTRAASARPRQPFVWVIGTQQFDGVYGRFLRPSRAG